MQHDFAPFDTVPEVMELDIDVLGVWSQLGNFSNLESATVVLKDLAIDCWLGGDHVITLSLELLDKFHDWNGCVECS